MWNVKQVQNDAVKMSQLETTFRDRVLNWFKKYSARQAITLAHVRTVLISEFMKHKSES